MKVLLVAERYWPEVGAAPSRLANMAEGLKGKGCEVDVLTSLPNYPKGVIFNGYRNRITKTEVHGGVNVFRYWIFATVSRNPIARIANMFSFAVMIWLFALKRNRVKSYDVVIIQTPTLVVAASAMMLFKSIYCKKCIINVSDIWPLTAADMGVIQMNSRSFRFMQKCEHYLYKKCDGVLGQSEEILNHVAQEMILLGCWNETDDSFKSNNIDDIRDSDMLLCSQLWSQNSHLFLYRNLQTYDLRNKSKKKGKAFKVVFCGMLGVAQDVASIVRSVPFKQLGVEFHILGGGKQLSEIEQWCKQHPQSNVVTHGFVPKEEISNQLSLYDASIVPLATRIRGAVPSKIYDLLPQGLPIIFCGGGEGANFIEKNKVGLISTPGDYRALTNNIIFLRDLSVNEYSDLSNRCVQVSRDQLNFDKQLNGLMTWLLSIC